MAAFFSKKVFPKSVLGTIQGTISELLLRLEEHLIAENWLQVENVFKRIRELMKSLTPQANKIVLERIKLAVLQADIKKIIKKYASTPEAKKSLFELNQQVAVICEN